MEFQRSAKVRIIKIFCRMAESEYADIFHDNLAFKKRILAFCTTRAYRTHFGLLCSVDHSSLENSDSSDDMLEFRT